MGWARIDRPLAHYAQDTGRAIVLTTFRIVTGRGACASEDTGFCCARGSRYRNPPGGDHFERNGLRPALLTALSYQFFHHVQSAADVTSQFMPTPLPGRGFGFLQTTFSPVIQPLSLRPGVPENLNSGLSDLLSMGSIVRNGLEALSPLSHLCVISITQSMGLAETERRTSSPSGGRGRSPLHGRYETARSVISRPLSIIANASRSCCSLMHSGGLV